MTDPENVRSYFPRLLDDEWSKKSECDVRYNCIAWGVCETRRWWWPGEPRADRLVFWPLHWREETVACFVKALSVRGFKRCRDGKPQVSWEKVAIYALSPDEVTHVARQLESGMWTSKLGEFEDIVHRTTEALEGPEYGTVHQYMRRRRDAGQDQA